MAVLPSPILYFDGVCNLCNGAVQFVIKRDKKKQIRFAALQSQAGEQAKKELVAIYGKVPDSIVLAYNGKYYTQSDAILQLASLLGGIFSIALAAYIIPRFIRNSIYDWIARNRYQWYGKKDNCMIPSAELKSRFLD